MAPPIFPIERQSQRTILAIVVVFTILPLTACVLRVVARRISNRRLDASDYLIFAALFLVFGYQAVNVIAVLVGGAGFHMKEIMAMHGKGPITSFLKILIAFQMFWSVTLSLVKLSILTLYTKIFTVRAFIWAARATGVIILLWALTTILLTFFICEPFESNWKPTMPGAHCGNRQLSYRVTGILNLVTDLIVLFLPMPYLYNLQLVLYKKVALMVTFALGLLTCIISCLRIVSISQVDHSDITFNVTSLVVYSTLEPTIGIVVACVPLLRPLISKGAYSKNGSAGYSSKMNSKGDGRFEQLQDNSSQYQLRPLGQKNATKAQGIQGSVSSHSIDIDERPGRAGRNSRGNIVVKQEWEISKT